MVRLKNYFIIILAAVCFIGCKTVKNNVRETYSQQKEVATHTKEETIEKEVIAATEEKWFNEFANIIEKIITEKFTPPDSAGRQYVVEKIIVEREIATQKAEAGKQKTESETTLQTNKTDNSTETTNIQEEKIDKTTTKRTTPLWILIPAIIVSLGIVLIIFLILRRYRIV